MQDGLAPTQGEGCFSLEGGAAQSSRVGLLVTALPGGEEAACLVACGEDEAQPRPRAVATTKGLDQFFQPLGVVAHGGERRLTEHGASMGSAELQSGGSEVRVAASIRTEGGARHPRSDLPGLRP